MAARPRSVDDASILEAAGRVIQRVGPAGVTLAEIAAEAGLSAAALVQRFGSKRGLMLALAESARDSVEACFAAVRAAHDSPLDALVAAATDMTKFIDTPEELANHMAAFVQTELNDAAFYAVTLENSKRMIAGYQRLLDEAVRAGELTPCDTARLAYAVSSLSGGSMVSWAVFREGTAEQWVRRDLATLLDRYTTPRPNRRSRRSPRRSSRRSRRS